MLSEAPCVAQLLTARCEANGVASAMIAAGLQS